MRKFIALILALSIVLALCVSSAAAEVSDSQSVSDSDLGEKATFEIEDFEYEIFNNGVLSFKFLLKNLSEFDFANVNLTYQVFDEEDNKVSTKSIIVFLSMHGESAWCGPAAAQLKEGQTGGYIRFIDAKATITEGNNPTGTIINILKGDVLDNVFPFGSCTLESTNDDGSTVETVRLSVGETLKTDSLEITLKDLAFEGSVDIGSGISLGASGDDMLLACLYFDIKNISKELMLVRDVLDVKVDYNEGFIYNTQDKYCYLLEAEDNDPSVCTFKYDGHASGTEFKLSPLSSDKFMLAIPCAQAVSEDNTSPLKVVFTLPNGDTAQNYEYIIIE